MALFLNCYTGVLREAMLLVECYSEMSSTRQTITTPSALTSLIIHCLFAVAETCCLVAASEGNG